MDKVTYVEGEEFDSTGLEVVAVYENGTKKAVEDYQLTGFE
ncbi:MAG: bacterial Ig-like domain-containing protein, partial [Ruminococcus sp.]|nr:bacterial Ig-like domain-containing protein [Ruminococcus sp.]